MLNDLDEAKTSDSAKLMSEILVDLQTLFEQQLKLFQLQMEQECRDRFWAVAEFAAGLGIFLLAAIRISEALAHLLHWAIAPPKTDPALLPFWACDFAVATVFFLVGLIVTQSGRRMFKSFEPHVATSMDNRQEHP